MVDKQIGKVIGKRIKQLRQSKGLTQEQVAEMLSFSTNHYSAIERGNYSIKIETLVSLINILDCSADDIFCDVVNSGYKMKASRLSDIIEKLDPSEQARIFDVLETMVKTATNK